MTWRELASHMTTNYEVLAMRRDSLSARWNGAGTRVVGPQKLVLIDSMVVGLRCVMLVALVGSEHGWSFREALINSSAFIVGGLALKDGAYSLRVSALLDTLRPPELDSLVEYAASKATELRKLLTAPSMDPAFFEWMRD